MNLFVSIIIPCKEIDSYAKECVEYCTQIDYKPYEIILLPDDHSVDIEYVKIISTGPITPGAKRNLGLIHSRGTLCAFLDSDAYPHKDWLKNAIKYFDDSEIAAVGGPGLTPENDTFMQRAGGFVLGSFMVGSLSKRYKSVNIFNSDDIQSCNFIVRKSVLLEVDGWNEKYWPGEDTLMSMAINASGNRMIEAHDVIVYHHRRPLFYRHLKQVSNYGVHRGFFTKKFKENSFKIQYFLPSFLVLFLFIGGGFTLINWIPAPIYLICLVSYFLLILVVSIFEVRQLLMISTVWLGILLTHICYGISFIVGYFRSDLRR